MKTIVEFGVRGGRYATLRFLTIHDGEHAASAIAWVLGYEWHPRLRQNTPRAAYTSATHFISLSKLDGVDRGPNVEAWRLPKDQGEQG